MCHTYIIYSATLNRYYIGSTRDELSERVRRHNSNHKGFTGKAPDWAIVYDEKYQTYSQAHERELQIKSWKSRKMIESLIRA